MYFQRNLESMTQVNGQKKEARPKEVPIHTTPGHNGSNDAGIQSEVLRYLSLFFTLTMSYCNL